MSLILILAGSIFVIFALFGVRTYKLFGSKLEGKMLCFRLSCVARPIQRVAYREHPPFSSSHRYPCSVCLSLSPPVGNKIIYVGFIFQAIGLIVLPVGFKDFGRACSQAAAGSYGCGQDPNCDADGKFDYFTLCSPHTFSTSFIISCVGVAVQMVSSIVYGCVDYEP